MKNMNTKHVVLQDMFSLYDLTIKKIKFMTFGAEA